MPSVKAIFSASAIAFFSTSGAHMILKTPAPYGSPNSSPLEPSGANFPCKATTNDGPTTEMPIGSSQQLSFTGSAVHGGGSCQVALTKDNPATKDSRWEVIHSIIGGCPSKQAGGNLPADPSGSGADVYPYKIPAGISPGTYTLAWTWFNKIGNREMYMNCANVKITGGSAKRDTYNNETYPNPELAERDTSFPDLFKANMPTTDCVTTEGGAVQFPSPGASVDRFGSDKTIPPTGPKCGGSGGSPSSAGTTSESPGTSGSDAGTQTGSGTGSGAAPASGSTPPSASSPSEGSVDTLANAKDSPSGAAAPAASSKPSAAGNSSTAPSADNGQSSTAAVPPSPPADSSAASASATSVECTQPGQSICSPDGKLVGQCGPTLKAVMITVPSGTICKGGLISWPRNKRTSRFFARHM